MPSGGAGLPPETPAALIMIFLQRNRAGSEMYLEWKVRLFLLGAALAMVGIALESTILISLATLVLLVGVALRFLGKGAGRGENADDVELGDNVAGDSEAES